MKIVGLLANICQHGEDCPKIHDTDGEDVIVQGDRLDLRDPNLHAAMRLPRPETAVVVPRTLLDGPRLTLTEMAEWIRERHHTHFLRIENRRSYGNAADNRDLTRFHAGEAEPMEGAQWREKIRTDAAAGKTRAKVHIVEDGKLSSYEQYAMEWGCPANAAAGEQLRVLDAPRGTFAGLPDFFVIEHEHVMRMHYDDADTFVFATPVTGADAAVYRALASTLWAQAADFTTWWSEHPHLHRDATT